MPHQHTCVSVLFRKSKNPNTNSFEIVAFFPETYKTKYVNYGNMMSYAHIGQHSEAHISYYRTTKKATPEEYNDLLNEIKSVYHDCEIKIVNRMKY